jgi:light-regulated signal transduction histidine kinase (bacteriophytochrome)
VASHDLKEPVRKIKTYYNRIMDEFDNTLPEKVKTYLERMNSATNRMYAMIEGVLNYSKLGNLEQTFRPVNLQEIIKEIKTDLDVLIQAKNAEITSKELPVINGSPILLYQLFYNLILNSLKFSKKEVPPQIRISGQKVREEGKDFFEITLSDNGIGFEPQFEKEIFGAFTRLNPLDEYEGTGLGLALCKKIVERHHGTLWAKGRVMEGATFSVRLPYAE